MKNRKKFIKWVVFISALIIVLLELFPIWIIISNGFKRDLDIKKRGFLEDFPSADGSGACGCSNLWFYHGME